MTRPAWDRQAAEDAGPSAPAPEPGRGEPVTLVPPRDVQAGREQAFEAALRRLAVEVGRLEGAS